LTELAGPTEHRRLATARTPTMTRLAAPLMCLASLALATGCSDRATDAPPPPAASAAAAEPTPTAAAADVAPVATETPAAPAIPPPSDPDHPLPLPGLTFQGVGAGKAESRYYAFDAGAGTITITATAKNAPSGATNALGVALYDQAANRLCFDTHGNTTTDKTIVVTCTVEKAQPLQLRLDLSAESLDHTIVLDGPITVPAAGDAAAATAVAGAGSTDIDAPTRLTTNRVQADGPGKPVAYYYTFNAGPGELTLIGDGRNTSAAATEALRLGLYNLRSERLCELTLGNTTLDKRATTTCHFDKREPVILRADLAAESVMFRARFEGAYDFEPYTPPPVVTIALDASVLFDTGKAVIKPEAQQTLHEAADRIRKFAGAAVTVTGHTDNVGSDASNQALSEQRAAAVKDYLVREEKLAAESLATRGYGSTQPVADNGTDAGRARNRRVDIVIDPKKQ
jgi:outer membrane protein OmpA-like peptidoglycan-associated protein